ncbi:MAG: ABC transporter permease [Lacisediminihabitans sp.]
MSTPIIVVLALLAWQLYINVSGISKFVLPSPWEVFGAFFHMIQQPYIWQLHVWTTLVETILGFIIGFLLGVTGGYLMGKFRPVEAIANPFVVASQVVPKVALVPLFILWFGFDISSKIAIASLLAFFPILVNTSFGIRSVSPAMGEMMTSLRATMWQRFRKLEIPHMTPYVLTGAEMGMILSLIGAIVGEYLAGDRGLGRLAVQLQNDLQVPELYGSILLMTLLGFALYSIFAVLRRVLIPWHESVLIRQRDS